jgi:hypothetical protein
MDVGYGAEENKRKEKKRKKITPQESESGVLTRVTRGAVITRTARILAEGR